MSEENVEIVRPGNVELARQAFEAVRHQDVDRLIALTHREVEWHSFFAELGEGGVYRGHDGMRNYVRDLADAWEFVDPVIDEALGVGSVVLLIGRVHYRGRGSGVDAEEPSGWVVRIRDELVAYFRALRDPEEALMSLAD